MGAKFGSIHILTKEDAEAISMLKIILEELQITTSSPPGGLAFMVSHNNGDLRSQQTQSFRRNFNFPF